MKTVTIELTKEELYHLQNDLISYIWNIKKRVFGDAWSFGCRLSEEEKALLTSEKEQELKESGYYSRLELKSKLDKIEEENFDVPQCAG